MEFWKLYVIFYLPPVLNAAAFRLANVYNDEMVLQMEPKSSVLWGIGEPGFFVSLQINGSDVAQTNVTDDGTWSIKLPPHSEGGPYLFTLRHGPSEVIRVNVWFGDVWVCSGQSNMEMTINQVHSKMEEIAKALKYTNLRLMQVQRSHSPVELKESKLPIINWAPPKLDNVPRFSALCLMFGERMSDWFNHSRPLGLIDATWGGTRIEAWSSARVTTACKAPATGLHSWKNAMNGLWNSMVKPLTSMAVRGAIWCQGEKNVQHNSDYYACHLENMIGDWKTSFEDGAVPVPHENGAAFPFGVVQVRLRTPGLTHGVTYQGPTLGPFRPGGVSESGYLRWHQTLDTGILPNGNLPEAFMAAAYDTTDPTSPTGDIHPRDKATVAERLSNAAKNLLYSADLHKYGPVPVAVSLDSPRTVTITYNMDVRVKMTAPGFLVRLTDSKWTEASVTSTAGRNVTVGVGAGTSHLAYAWTSVVGDYKAGAVYSQDEQALPAQAWLWDLAALRNAQPLDGEDFEEEDFEDTTLEICPME